MSYSEPYVSNGTGVFWDMDHTSGRSSAELVPFLRQMLLSVGLRGPTSIRIYGDLTGLDFETSEDVKLNHFNAGDKRAKMTKLLEDIVSWSADNPEPSLGVLFLGHLEEADAADVTEVTQLLKAQKNYHFVVVNAPPPPPPTVIFMRSIPRGGL